MLGDVSVVASAHDLESIDALNAGLTGEHMLTVRLHSSDKGSSGDIYTLVSCKHLRYVRFDGCKGIHGTSIAVTLIPVVLPLSYFVLHVCS